MILQGDITHEGFRYLEAARWHAGALWFSDIGNRTIWRIGDDGVPVAVSRIAERPSGLGWDADGALLAISMEDSGLRRIAGDGAPVPMRDLAPHLFHANDMCVDRDGRAYVTHFGYDLFSGAQPTGTYVLVVHPDGRMERCGEGLVFPNGVALSEDGRTLIVAESFGARLAAFSVLPDGGLAEQRVFADFGDPALDVLDGLTIDRDMGVWVAAPFRGEFWRVTDGGTITDRVRPAAGGGTYCVDCALGGPDMRTLFMLVADTTVERMANDWDSTATIQQVRVDIPGFPA